MESRLSVGIILICLLPLMGGSCSGEGSEKEIIKDYREVKFDPYDITEIIQRERDRPFFSPEEDIAQCQKMAKTEEASGNWFPVDGRGGACYKRDVGNYDALSMAFLSQDGLLPYIVLQKKGLKERSKIKTAIFLVGGPQNSLRGLSDSLYFLFSKSLLESHFDRVILPAYYGTAHRDAFPRSDTEAAAEEIKNFIDAILSNVESSESGVSLIGFSGGSLVLNEIKKKRPKISVVMISAPLDSIANLPLGRPFLSSSVSKRDREYAALLVGGNGKHFGSLSSIKLLRPPLKLWYDRYFGPYFTQKSLRPILEQRTLCQIAVIGTRDQVISEKRYDFRGLHAKFIEGMEHIPKGDEFRQVAMAVGQSIKCQDEMAAVVG